MKHIVMACLLASLALSACKKDEAPAEGTDTTSAPAEGTPPPAEGTGH